MRWLATKATAAAKIQLNEKIPPIWMCANARAKSIRDYPDLFVILAEPPVAKNNLWATMDVLLTPNRDRNATEAFVHKAI